MNRHYQLSDFSIFYGQLKPSHDRITNAGPDGRGLVRGGGGQKQSRLVDLNTLANMHVIFQHSKKRTRPNVAAAPFGRPSRASASAFCFLNSWRDRTAVWRQKPRFLSSTYGLDHDRAEESLSWLNLFCPLQFW